MTSPEAFDTTMSAWKAEQDTPWFRLRYAVVLDNIEQRIGAAPLRVLDVGSGNGRETLVLAARGHHVTLVDYSAEMLADARRAAEHADLADSVTIYQADITTLPTLFEPESFDLVLCHNVLQYVADPAAGARILGSLVRAGGHVSVVCPNRYGETYMRALLHNDLATALQHLDATSVEATLFKVPVHRWTGDEMVQLLREAGCDDATQYGVLCVCAYIADNDIKYDPAFFAQLEQLEHALTARHPYNLMGRFFQAIARKETGMGDRE